MAHDTTNVTTALNGRRAVALVWGWLVVSSAWASAGVILQDTGGGRLQINFAEPVGQTFTTIDTNINFAFWLLPINPHFPNSDPIELNLYEGAGIGGALLATTTTHVPTGLDGYFDVDFTSIPLALGSVYTATASIVGTSPYWGISVGSFDPYGGGDFVAFGTVRPGGDARFRVTGFTVPVPPTFMLMSLGIAGLVSVRRARPRGSVRRALGRARTD